jgi:hypothetical protein
MLIVSLRAAYVLLVLAATLLAMAILAEKYITETAVGLVLAGQIVGRSTKGWQ